MFVRFLLKSPQSAQIVKMTYNLNENTKSNFVEKQH
jgi:hypothetical protein